MKTLSALAVVTVVLVSATGVGAMSIDVGVLNIEKVGGTGFGETGIFQLLENHPDFKPEWISDLQPHTIAQFRVLMIADVHQVGDLAQGWEKALRAYTEGGGGVVMTHDCQGLKPEALFPEIEAGSERHVGQRISSFTSHPLTFGLSAFDTARVVTNRNYVA